MRTRDLIWNKRHFFAVNIFWINIYLGLLCKDDIWIWLQLQVSWSLQNMKKFTHLEAKILCNFAMDSLKKRISSKRKEIFLNVCPSTCPCPLVGSGLKDSLIFVRTMIKNAIFEFLFIRIDTYWGKICRSRTKSEVCLCFLCGQINFESLTIIIN